MPAACSPCAIDHAIERLLATPKTTAFRPCKSEDMLAPWEWERITVVRCLFYAGDDELSSDCRISNEPQCELRSCNRNSAIGIRKSLLGYFDFLADDRGL